MALHHTDTIAERKPAERRLGRVEISDALLRRSMNTDELLALFAGSFTLDIERHWRDSKSTYMLWNGAFRCVEEGEIAPYYTVTCTKGDDGTITVEWSEASADSEIHAITPEAWSRMLKEGGAA